MEENYDKLKTYSCIFLLKAFKRLATQMDSVMHISNE